MKGRWLNALRKRQSRGGRRLSTAAAEGALVAREGFGSFHSEDIEKLLRLSAVDYVPPAIHHDISSSVLTPRFVEQLQDVKYGTAECKKLLFHLDPTWTFLNHGAFGGALKPLMHEAAAWRIHAETQPLRYFDRELLPLVAFAIRAMAAHLKCSPTQLLPLPNVTSGLNAIMATLEPTLKRGDTLVCTNLTYGATKKMLQALAQRTGSQLVILPLRLPLSADSCFEDFKAIMTPTNLKSPRLIVLDSVTSNTALSLPVTRIVQYIRAAYPSGGAVGRIGIDSPADPVVVIDAAHSLHSDPALSLHCTDGQLLYGGADAWLSNSHKWLCTPKGTAFMWVGDRLRRTLRPAVISHGFDVTIPPVFKVGSDMNEASSRSESSPSDGERVHSAFSWDGCRDYASIITTPSALRVWSLLPPSHAYRASLLEQASELLMDDWCSRSGQLISAGADGTEIEAEAEAVAHRLPSSPMRLVPLPPKVRGLVTNQGCSDTEAFQLQEWLHHSHRIEVPIKCIEGRLYVRISAHVYNHLDEYRALSRAVRED